MITKEQLKLANKQWKQAREAAILAHEYWALLIKFRNELLGTCREPGLPSSKETQHFEKLMEEHSKNYKAALEHMEKITNIHQQLLDMFEDERP
ncbi:hypothetical protein [Vreelandella stevensii]|uniref:hypothetical protein n=1 Tax=Vreelandella stevensii TaxID=502821 RepID=UPI00403B2EF5